LDPRVYIIGEAPTPRQGVDHVRVG